MTSVVLFPYTGTWVGGSYVSSSLIAQCLQSTPDWIAKIALPERGPNAHVFERLGLQPDYFGLDSNIVKQLRRSQGYRGKIRALAAYREVYRAAIRYMQNDRPDIVHINDDRTILTWGPAARKLGIPVVWHIRQERGNLYLDRWRLRLSDHMIFVADLNRERFRQQGKLPPNGTIYNGVDFSTFYPTREKPKCKRRLRLDPGKITIGFVGNLMNRKRPEWFVQAGIDLLKQGKSIEMLLIGADHSGGTYEPRLRRLVQEAGAEEHFHFLGFRDDIADVMRAMDILAFTSIPRGEGFPRVIIEAMASGVAVVATRVAGVPEAITDGTTGMLVDARSYEGFLTSLGFVVDDADHREAIAAAGLREARDRFSNPSVAEQVIDVYRSLL